MASGDLPTYAYRPSPKSGEPVLRAVGSRRSRLFAGGTYFRARDPGRSGNNITVEVFEYAPYEGGTTGEAYCVITNQNLKFDENVIGAPTSILDLKGTYADLWIIDELDTPIPRTQEYSISLRIAFQRQEALPFSLPTPTLISGFFPEKLFSTSGKLSVKTAKKTPDFTAIDTVIVSPRYRIYQLSGKDFEDTETMTFTYGWNIDALRAAVNANDPWVQMMERSGPIDDGMGGSTPNPSPVDAQDEGSDSTFLTPFEATRLADGDGLPDNPNRENTGPFKSLVLVNYGELPNGSMGEHNTVYEWVGDSDTAGIWKAY